MGSSPTFGTKKIIKQKFNISPEIERKINWTSKYTNTKVEFIKGNLIGLEPTNIAYIEPHRVIVNESTFMFIKMFFV